MSYVFISYVRENERHVAQLCDELEGRGAEIWRDRKDISAGMRWKRAIRTAIEGGAFFIACFSKEFSSRTKSYMHEELTEAIEELRQRSTDRTWFIPIKLNECEIPDREIGGGETLRDFHYIDLSMDWDAGIRELLAAVQPVVSHKLIDTYTKLAPQITMARDHAKYVLSEAFKHFNELGILRRSSVRAQKQALKYLKTYRFRFDGQFNVVNSERIIIFHDVEDAIGRQYGNFLSEFDDILNRHVIGKDTGSIKWVDLLASDYKMIDPAYDSYSSDMPVSISIDWIRLNVAPFLYLQSWDWYILVESHIKIPGLTREDIQGYFDYLKMKGWLIIPIPYVLRRVLRRQC